MNSTNRPWWPTVSEADRVPARRPQRPCAPLSHGVAEPTWPRWSPGSTRPGPRERGRDRNAALPAHGRDSLLSGHLRPTCGGGGSTPPAPRDPDVAGCHPVHALHRGELRHRLAERGRGALVLGEQLAEHDGGLPISSHPPPRRPSTWWVTSPAAGASASRSRPRSLTTRSITPSCISTPAPASPRREPAEHWIRWSARSVSTRMPTALTPGTVREDAATTSARSHDGNVGHASPDVCRSWKTFSRVSADHPSALEFPKSQPAPVVRATPLWSVGGQTASSAASTAGLPPWSAWVAVGPPLAANGPSSELVPG